MYLFKKTADLQQYLQADKTTHQQVGFVPTMGALHQGHLALIKESIRHCDYTICSIFVNPTQFNEPADLEKYPRTPAKDIELLEKVGCDILYMPQPDEIYPADLDTSLDIPFEGLDTVLEGKFRPGHFEGVAQVVKRLLELLKPDQLFMGQKDYQQTRIVQRLIDTFDLPVQLEVQPTIREADGLAMSSRNVRLSAEGRQLAPLLYRALQATAEVLPHSSPQAARQKGLHLLNGHPVEVEYFEIVDATNLNPVSEDHTGSIVICLAAWIDGVRLIDNLLV
jgi:pantoate--beta-alanine ligase